MASALAKQIHSIDIGRKSTDGSGLWTSLKNTWDDYHLVPSSRPVVNPPEPKTNYIDVPGIDGVLDMSTALIGTMLYKNREGSWDFVVANDYEPWEFIFHKLKNDLHGKVFDVRLMDEPSYYYKGRLSINEWKSEQNWSKVTIDYHFKPYKYELNTGNEPWLWDPFSFKTGIIRKYGAATIRESDTDAVTFLTNPLVVAGEDSLTVRIPGSERIQPIIIHVISGSDLTVKIGGGTYPYPLHQGENNMTTDVLSIGVENPTHAYIRDTGAEWTFVFSGSGHIWMEFQGGWL